MTFRQTTRSVDDLLYSLGTSLQRFKGQNGLKRVLDAGRLSWLSFVGEFQETRDELFARRTYSLNSTRKCLLTLNELFEDVTRYASKMTEKVDQITKTLDTFHRCCDLELENPEDTDNTDYVIAEEKLREMRKVSSDIQKVLNDFCDSASTCKTLNVSTVAQLEEVDKETAGIVGRAQTDFDAQRRRVQVKEDELSRLRGMGARPGSDQLQFAEFNLQYENETLQKVGDAYFVSLQEAMNSTSFALEQTCMATWASSNVFFVQQERKAMLEALHPRESLVPPPRATEGTGAGTPGGSAPSIHATTAAPKQTPFDDLEDLFGPAAPPTVAASASSQPEKLATNQQSLSHSGTSGQNNAVQAQVQFQQHLPHSMNDVINVPSQQAPAPLMWGSPTPAQTNTSSASIPAQTVISPVLPPSLTSSQSPQVQWGAPQQPPPQQPPYQHYQHTSTNTSPQYHQDTASGASVLGGYPQAQQQQSYSATAPAVRSTPPLATTQQQSPNVDVDGLFQYAVALDEG